MSRPAFRPAAVAAQNDRLQHHSVSDHLASAAKHVFVLIVLLITIGGIIVFVPLPRTIAIEGVVTVSPGPIRITSPGSGTVITLLIEEGAEVRSGMVLTTISRPAEGIVAAKALRSSLGQLSEVRALEAEEIRLKGESRARQIDLAEQRIRQMDVLISRSEYSFDLLSAEAERLTMLQQQGLAVLSAVNETQQSTIAAEMALMNLQNDRLTIQADIVELQGLQEEEMADWRSSDARLAAELAEMESQLATLDAPSIVEVTAPISGRVEFVQSRPGQSVAAGADLMVISPPVVSWSADLYMTARQSSALRSQPEFAVTLAAPDGREFRVRASLAAVSTTPIPAENVSDTVKLGVSDDTPVYRARLQFDTQTASEAGLYVGQPLRTIAFLKPQSLFNRVSAAQASDR
ncbi:HlyD family efflux transporter periplasmic adaptor subunit [Cognatiyoonia sp. IB215446]|uniref:HlyD family secretion protein n=1 Tax=Cognatiyoonia sp. IB215446 TaxID=3097355 RepID=UPI002A0BE85E|nr:HlyD family efflux transporter periplasmic adaptor subunit [Cognatiyoonia sp. IB215446]MDX8346921.1 HlyD family efflux transporter periplasmic adaptor subunit [Cognatiyoonia sp. IB215446]